MKNNKHIIKRLRGLVVLTCAMIFQKGKVYFHPYRSYFDSNVRISVTEQEGKLLLEQIMLSENCCLDVSGELEIGNNTFFNRNCIIACKRKIVIGNDCSFGPNVCIYDHDHQFGKNGQIKGEFKSTEVVIGNNVWVGAGVIILRGAQIGDNCIIGAGAIIDAVVRPYTLVSPLREFVIKAL